MFISSIFKISFIQKLHLFKNKFYVSIMTSKSENIRIGNKTLDSKRHVKKFNKMFISSFFQNDDLIAFI